MEIPQAVRTAASELIEIFGDHIVHLGRLEDSEVYTFQLPENSITGFPFVFLLDDDGSVEDITGPRAFQILNEMSVI